MNVGTTQSQTLIATLRFSQTAVRTQGTTPAKDILSRTAEGAASAKDVPSRTAAVDVVEVGVQVDGRFVSRVLQDSLEERLNAALEKAGVEMSAGELLSGGMDSSPQATATRIVDFAVSFHAAYQGTHQGEEGAVQLEGFVGLIKGAMEEGFAGARELLDGFAEMSEEIEGGIGETFDLAMRGIDAFAEEQRQAMGKGEDGEPGVGAI